MKLPKAVQDELDEIEKDCIRLRRSGNLTEYGQGQLDIIKLIKEICSQRETD